MVWSLSFDFLVRWSFSCSLHLRIPHPARLEATFVLELSIHTVNGLFRRSFRLTILKSL
jgi:hypothetical protein